MAIEREEIERLAKDRDDELQILDRNVYGRLREFSMDKEVARGPKGMRKGSTVTAESLSDVPRSQWWEIALKDESAMAGIEAIRRQYDEAKRRLEQRFVDKIDKLKRGDELPPGVMKMVKVFVAVKRKLQPGDKMAGRHGNKGVISQIVPIEDMPYLEDGDAGRHRAQSAGGAEPHECRPDPGNPSGLGLPRPRTDDRTSRRAFKASQQSRRAEEAARRDLRRQRDRSKHWTRRSARRAVGQSAPGVPVATPVFDGAGEADIVEC